MERPFMIKGKELSGACRPMSCKMDELKDWIPNEIRLTPTLRSPCIESIYVGFTSAVISVLGDVGNN